MTYGYKVVNGAVLVTPLVYACKLCSFKTQSKEEEQQHYYGVGHFSETTLPPELTEEWDEEKHGVLPSHIAAQLDVAQVE